MVGLHASGGEANICCPIQTGEETKLRGRAAIIDSTLVTRISRNVFYQELKSRLGNFCNGGNEKCAKHTCKVLRLEFNYSLYYKMLLQLLKYYITEQKAIVTINGLCA